MKYTKIRRGAAALLAVLTLALSCGAQAALPRSAVLTLARGLSYEDGTRILPTGGRLQTHTLTYTPGQDIRPLVLHGGTVYGRNELSALLAQAKNRGLEPVAAVNADFFTLTTGIPEGLLVSGGRLLSSDSYQNAVGITADGRFFIGRPQLQMRLTGAGKSVSVTYINKLRTTQGVYLLTEDFDATTHLSREGLNVLLRITDGSSIKIGGSVALEVAEIRQAAADTPIPAGYMVLTAAMDGPVESLQTLAVGDALTLTVTSQDTRWNEAVYACGAGETLVSGGAAAAGLPSSPKPCTALGLRQDGSAVLIAADGRQPGYSDGISLAQLAQELLAQGCTTAVNLDGGGSTTLHALYPGMDAGAVVNSPSDGYLRACSNYIVFVNTAPRSGAAAMLHLYPYDAYVLAGGQIPFTVKASDSTYHAAAVPAGAAVTAAGLGAMQGNTFFAGDTAGQTSVTASAPGLSGASARVTVCTQVDSLAIREKGRSLRSIAVAPGASLDFDALAMADNQKVYAADEQFTWTVTGGVGTVGPDGVFRAANLRGLSGGVTLSYGGQSTQIQITVGEAPAVLDSFESVGAWSGGAEVQVSAEHDAACVCYGFGSLKAAYTLAAGDQGPQALITRQSLALPSGANYVNLWVYASGGATHIALRLQGGGEHMTTLPQPLQGTGWQLVNFDLSAGLPAAAANAPLSLDGVVLTGPQGGKGTVWLDQMSAGPAVLSAESGLQVQIQSLQAAGLSALVRDARGYTVPKANIAVRLDGRDISFEYDPASGQLSAAPVELGDAAAHRVTVTARDVAGNLARASADLKAAAPAAGFADMDGHWAAAYVDFLRARGTLTGEQSGGKLVYHPQRNTSRQEMAALVARWLGLNVEKSASLALPYGDLSEIEAWALPYVKAMYAEGLMTGSSSGGKLLFHPKSSVTRAEVMTILGRTLPRGYPEGQTAYADAASIPAWALPHVRLLSALGVVSGYGDGTILPAAPVTRAEVAAMLYRLY